MINVDDTRNLDDTINKLKEKVAEIDKSIEECRYCANRKIDKIMGLSELHKKDIECMLEDKAEYESIIGWLQELKTYRNKE